VTAVQEFVLVHGTSSKWLGIMLYTLAFRLSPHSRAGAHSPILRGGQRYGKQAFVGVKSLYNFLRVSENSFALPHCTVLDLLAPNPNPAQLFAFIPNFGRGFDSHRPLQQNYFDMFHAAAAAPFGSNWNCFWTCFTGISPVYNQSTAEDLRYLDVVLTDSSGNPSWPAPNLGILLLSRRHRSPRRCSVVRF